jgi:uncharacterized membrane protein YeaQ/YmgE (transglycosylase-associated protein family)
MPSQRLRPGRHRCAAAIRVVTGSARAGIAADSWALVDDLDRGIAAGLLANMLIPGKRSQGLILTCLIGIAGALLGGWLATKLFHIHSLHGFFNLSTWITAIIGAAILLLAFHLITSRSGRSRRYAHR